MFMDDFVSMICSELGDHFSVMHIVHSKHFSVTNIGHSDHFSVTHNGDGNQILVTTITRMMKKKA